MRVSTDSVCQDERLRCRGLSYNGWLHITPQSVLDSMVMSGMLKRCTKHPDRLLLSPQGIERLEASIFRKESNDGKSEV